MLSRLKPKLHNPLLLLLILALATRLPIILSGTIPFTFDHGKDSLAILHMLKTLSPKLIGPWTSIPGIYFGPAWYYLLAPGYFLLDGNPIAGPLTMVLLGLLNIFLAYRFFGFWPALILSSAPAFIAQSTSAWNPFPLTFLLILVAIILHAFAQKQALPPSLHFLLFFTVSLTFHFSSAYAVSFLITLPLILIYRKYYQRFTKKPSPLPFLGSCFPSCHKSFLISGMDFPNLKP